MKSHRSSKSTQTLPWEPKTFIFRGYNPYIGGVRPSFFMVLGPKGIHYAIFYILNFPLGFCISQNLMTGRICGSIIWHRHCVHLWFLLQKNAGETWRCLPWEFASTLFFFYGFYYMGFITMFHQHLGELLFVFYSKHFQQIQALSWGGVWNQPPDSNSKSTMFHGPFGRIIVYVFFSNHQIFANLRLDPDDLPHKEGSMYLPKKGHLFNRVQHGIHQLTFYASPLTVRGCWTQKCLYQWLVVSCLVAYDGLLS